MSVSLDQFLKVYPGLKRIVGEERLRKWYEKLVSHLGPSVDLVSYLPLFLKKNVKAEKLENYFYELADYEWSQEFLKSFRYESRPQNQSEIPRYELSSSLRILRLEHDILMWVREEIKNSPSKRPQVLMFFYNPLTNTGEVHEVSVHEAAVIDSLSESPLSESALFDFLKESHGPNPELERLWQSAFKNLLGLGVLVPATELFQ
jgi:hypothetical protein